MPLVIKIGTTTDHIAEITVTRRGRDYSTDPDSVHEYTMRRDGEEIATFKHRYGDGAIVLAALATTLAVPAQEHAEKGPEGPTEATSIPPDPDDLPEPQGRRQPHTELFSTREEMIEDDRPYD